MPLFIKKPEVVEAVRWLGEVGTPACVRRSFIPLPDPNFAVVDGISGVHTIRPGDWVVMRPNGDNHPVREELFHEIYEPAPEEGESTGQTQTTGDVPPAGSESTSQVPGGATDGDKSETQTKGARQGILLKGPDQADVTTHAG